ncbi:hypothetical protein QR680_017328 [Steinernema hermaphroditum]|uniref:G-protein coupled receptors family 1 profile domain-containing protein n=1 Tax=Steinernema hermaphroditum TaxID=289476 RepID=A0AA39HE55_9BILA|nr:hypothetical protein QR680_017328 [Steinernema hermaphroditum]
MSLVLVDSLHMVSLEDSVAAFVMFTLCVSGLFVSSLAILFVRRTKALRNVFGSLCLSHAVADIGVLLIILLYAVPVTLLPKTFVASRFVETISPRIGQLGILLWNVCVYSHLLIAGNRFVAICFPLRFQAVPQRSFFVVAVEGCVWCFGVAHSIPYSWPQCGFTYNPRSHLWDFAPNACGGALMFVDFIEGLSCVSAIVALDLVTFFKIRCAKPFAGSWSQAENRRRNRQQIIFFVQGCCQGSLFIAKLLSFYFFSNWNADRWYLFATTSVAWQLSHVLDGVVLLVFNPEFRRRFRKTLKVRQVAGANVASSSHITSTLR